MVSQPLRRVLLAAIAEGHVHQTGAVEHDAGTEMVASTRLGCEPKQDFDGLHAPVAGTAGKLAARDLGAVVAQEVFLRIRPVDPAVAHVLRMERDIEQSALPLRIDRGESGYRHRIE